MQTETNNQQLGLIGFDDAINNVFGGKDLKDKNGAIVGSSFSVKSRKDIAAVLDLKGKENKDRLDAAILNQSDAAFRVVKGKIASLGADWTLSRVASRTLSDGVRQISVVVKEIKRNTGPSDEAIAKSLGISVAEVQAMRARQTAALEAQSQPVNVSPAEEQEAANKTATTE